jgi:Calcineurin-like phosphoesterase
MNRILDLDAGRVMVVTDVHGDYAAYGRYRDRFLALRAEGQADVFLLAGDYLHCTTPQETDRSLEIALDLLRLRDILGPALVVLLGNHEFPHLYGITISKGSLIYGPRFEKAMGPHRPAILAFIDSLPFYVRTRAGVALAHAGACEPGTTAEGLQRLSEYSHQGELEKVEAFLADQDRASLRAGLSKLSDQNYAAMAAENLGITDPADPRYDDLLRGILVTSLSPGFQNVWEALFNKNEDDYGELKYARILKAFLNTLSVGYIAQCALVAGHIAAVGGHQVVANRQLRLASWTHAHPVQTGEYLLFDAGEPIGGVEDLLPGLRRL